MVPTPLLLKHFSLHPSRLKTLSELISGLISGCNVQVSSLSKALSGEANIYSKQKRILTLAVVQNGIAVPILFMPLKSCGNSSTAERIEIIESFINMFGKHSIELLLADREFIGEKWFKWLEESQVSFAIRIKANQLLKHPNGGTMQAGRMCKHDKTYDTDILGQSLQISCKELTTEKLIIAHSPSVHDAVSLYAKRWDIETMFKALKTNGFNLEMSHMKCKNKFKKILQIAAISFALAVKSTISFSIPP